MQSKPAGQLPRSTADHVTKPTHWLVETVCGLLDQGGVNVGCGSQGCFSRPKTECAVARHFGVAGAQTKLSVRLVNKGL
jgi:hypothetical protein